MMTRAPEPLTPEEEAEARRYFTEPAPPRYNPMAWREWANSLSWKVGLYGARLFATLDAARAAVPDTGASLDVERLADAINAVWREQPGLVYAGFVYGETGAAVAREYARLSEPVEP